ncbi:hypothetical protein [Ascidiimonas aurantiaca]|uniref:hypothetical protein n=1 Tax=Ascidiimonas aurantiaca TaxID=1685432 RepID=UPI0030EE22B5
MSYRNLVIITKIIFYYCLFYIGVKVYGVFSGMWFLPNIVVILLLAVTGGLAAFFMIKKKYNWPYAIAGILIIVLLRIYESRLISYLYENF